MAAERGSASVHWTRARPGSGGVVWQDRPPSVGVVGGSLAGLTAALLLRDAGCDVDVFERSPAGMQGGGAGMAVHEPTVRYIVGRTGRTLEDVSVATQYHRFLDSAGDVAHEDAVEIRFSTWGTLYHALLEAFGQERYHSEIAVQGSTGPDFGESADLLFRDGHHETFDLVIGADGVRSTLRTHLAPEVDFTTAGYVAWRGVVRRSLLSPETAARLSDAVTYYIGDRTHILTYPVPRGLRDEAEDGEARMNFAWYRNYAGSDEVDDLLTDATGTHRQVSIPPGAARAETVARMREQARAELSPPFAELVCAADEPFLQLIGDLAVPRMVWGRQVLIGDAAFVARPHPAAGAAKAAQDAWALAATVEAWRATGALDLAGWQDERLGDGMRLVRHAADQGERAQQLGTWVPGDPFFSLALFSQGAR